MGKPSQMIHDFGDVDFTGAPGGTGEARGAEPDRFAGQDLLFHAQLNHSDNLIGKIIHLEREGAAGGTFPALIAIADLLAAFLLYGFTKRRSYRVLRNNQLHKSLSTPAFRGNGKSCENENTEKNNS